MIFIDKISLGNCAKMLYITKTQIFRKKWKIIKELSKIYDSVVTN